MDLSFEIDSFLDEKEVQAVLFFYKKLPKTLNDGTEKKAYTTGFPPKLLPSSIKNKLKNVFGESNITGSMILEEFVPWGVHTDYFKNDSNPYYAALIPLERVDKAAHTIVFNEEGITKNWKDLLTVRKNHCIKPEHLDLLSHIDQEILQKISVKTVHRWQRGKLIAWHRSLLHTSDNFHDAGLEKKTALVLWMNKDD